MSKAKKEVPTVVIERSIRIISRVPLDEDHYPDMTSIQAIDYELQLPRDEKIRLFQEELNLITETGAVELTESVRLEQ